MQNADLQRTQPLTGEEERVDFFYSMGSPFLTDVVGESGIFVVVVVVFVVTAASQSPAGDVALRRWVIGRTQPEETDGSVDISEMEALQPRKNRHQLEGHKRKRVGVVLRCRVGEPGDPGPSNVDNKKEHDTTGTCGKQR